MLFRESAGRTAFVLAACFAFALTLSVVLESKFAMNGSIKARIDAFPGNPTYAFDGFIVKISNSAVSKTGLRNFRRLLIGKVVDNLT